MVLFMYPSRRPSLSKVPVHLFVIMFDNMKSSNLSRFSFESNQLVEIIVSSTWECCLGRQVLYLRPRVRPGPLRVLKWLLVPWASNSQQTCGQDGHQLFGSRSAFGCVRIAGHLGTQCLVHVGVWGNHPTSPLLVCLRLLHALGAQFRGGFCDARLVEEIMDGQEICPEYWQDAEGWAVDICAPAACGVDCGRLCDFLQVGVCMVEESSFAIHGSSLEVPPFYETL